jgi:hypothetical protein
MRSAGLVNEMLKSAGVGGLARTPKASIFQQITRPNPTRGDPTDKILTKMSQI